MSVLLLAQSTSDNAPGGANFTLWFPAGLFIIVAAIFYVIHSRPHTRVPPRRPAHAQASSAAPTASASAKEEAAEPGSAGAEASE